MAFYIRKALRVGPFRLNLSKSGIGISSGIKGLRLGSGPRGNYVHMGRGGLYYRKFQSSSRSKQRAGQSQTPSSLKQTRPVPTSPDIGMQDIDSAPAYLIMDSSSAELANEFSTKIKKVATAPIVLWIFIPLTVLTWLGSQNMYPAILLSLFTALLFVSAKFWDTIRKTVVLMYDLEPEFEEIFKAFYTAFERLKQAGRIWHVSAIGQARDSKYHAGASELIQRHRIHLQDRNPPHVRTNVPTPSIPAGRQTLYFFPDRLLVFERHAVGVLSYSSVEISIRDDRFIETESLPHDAMVVGKTWRYVNKKGGPDKRFRDNRELPIALYEAVHFKSQSGLNEMLQVSKRGIAAQMKSAVTQLASASHVEVARSKPQIDRKNAPLTPNTSATGTDANTLSCPSCGYAIDTSFLIEGVNTCPHCADTFKIAYE